MNLWRNLAVTVFALSLAACAQFGGEVDNDATDVIGSHLAQPPPGTPPQTPVDAGDIAIVGQEVAHSIMDLPVISSATIPPLVRFNGVTSIMDKPIDTEPYTELLRDRLLLITREKLRFVEHTLPPYVPPGKHKNAEPQPVQNTTDADYEILAELRGHAEHEFYKIQVEFVDSHSGAVLFNGLYRIRKEASVEPEAPASEPPPQAEAPAQPLDNAQPPPPPTTGNDITAPTTNAPTSTENAPL